MLQVRSPVIESVFPSWVPSPIVPALGDLSGGEVDWRTDQMLLDCAGEVPKLFRRGLFLTRALDSH